MRRDGVGKKAFSAMGMGSWSLALLRLGTLCHPTGWGMTLVEPFLIPQLPRSIPFPQSPLGRPAMGSLSVSLCVPENDWLVA